MSTLQGEINKMTNTLSQNKIQSKEYDVLVHELNYRTDISCLRNMRHMFSQIKVLYDQLMFEFQKQSSSNQLAQIKTLPRIGSRDGLWQIIICDGMDNKAITQAIAELANADSDNGYIIINKGLTKLQYFVAINKLLVASKHLSANEIVRKFNLIASGSGGGRDVFAQGGTQNMSVLPELLKGLN
jgi:alanyl-tRNA synthetase